MLENILKNNIKYLLFYESTVQYIFDSKNYIPTNVSVRFFLLRVSLQWNKYYLNNIEKLDFYV